MNIPDEAVEAAAVLYEVAQARLLDLIDGPNCPADMSEYRRELKHALQAVQRAHKQMMGVRA